MMSPLDGAAVSAHRPLRLHSAHRDTNICAADVETLVSPVYEYMHEYSPDRRGFVRRLQIIDQYVHFIFRVDFHQLQAEHLDRAAERSAETLSLANRDADHL